MTDAGARHRVVRYLGAATLLAVGIDHIQQYVADDYSVIPTIGTLFAANFVASVVLATGLVAPIERVSRRWGRLLLGCLALGGIGVAAGSLIGLLVSEQSGLFGFMETGYRQSIVLAIVLEVLASVLLGTFLVETMRRRRESA
jgi:MFS family permease